MLVVVIFAPVMEVYVVLVRLKPVSLVVWTELVGLTQMETLTSRDSIALTITVFITLSTLTSATLMVPKWKGRGSCG